MCLPCVVVGCVCVCLWCVSVYLVCVPLCCISVCWLICVYLVCVWSMVCVFICRIMVLVGTFSSTHPGSQILTQTHIRLTQQALSSVTGQVLCSNPLVLVWLFPAGALCHLSSQPSCGLLLRLLLPPLSSSSDPYQTPRLGMEVPPALSLLCPVIGYSASLLTNQR